MILNAIKKAFADKLKRGWDTVYFAVDIHDTILIADYNNTTLNFFPHAKEALQLISQQEDIVCILFTCSHPEEIERYQNFFTENNLKFKYVNENPEVINTRLGCFDKKFYSNVIFDDKAGFDATTEWVDIEDYFVRKEVNKVLDRLKDRKLPKKLVNKRNYNK